MQSALSHSCRRWWCVTLFSSQSRLCLPCRGRLGPARDTLRALAQEDPPEPTLRTDRHALDRLVRINQAVKNIPHAVLFLGDSLTEGWDPEVWGQNLGSSRGAE